MLRATRRLLFYKLLHRDVRESTIPFSGLFHFTLVPYLIMPRVKQCGTKYHFWIFGMTWSGIELRSPRPLTNTLPTGQCKYIYIYIHIYIYMCVCVCVYRERERERGREREREDDSFLIKTHILRFVCVHVEINASCCLLQVMQQGFGLGRCICKKRYVICIVCFHYSFCWISSASCFFLV